MLRVGGAQLSACQSTRGRACAASCPADHRHSVRGAIADCGVASDAILRHVVWKPAAELGCGAAAETACVRAPSCVRAIGIRFTYCTRGRANLIRICYVSVLRTYSREQHEHRAKTVTAVRDTHSG